MIIYNINMSWHKSTLIIILISNCIYLVHEYFGSSATIIIQQKKVPLLLIKECLTSLSLVSSSIPFPFFCFLILSSSCYCIMDGLHCLSNSSNGFPIFLFSSHSWLWILEKNEPGHVYAINGSNPDLNPTDQPNLVKNPWSDNLLTSHTHLCQQLPLVGRVGVILILWHNFKSVFSSFLFLFYFMGNSKIFIAYFHRKLH